MNALYNSHSLTTGIHSLALNVLRTLILSTVMKIKIQNIFQIKKGGILHVILHEYYGRSTLYQLHQNYQLFTLMNMWLTGSCGSSYHLAYQERPIVYCLS